MDARNGGSGERYSFSLFLSLSRSFSSLSHTNTQFVGAATASRVVVFVSPRDGHEVRQLPEELRQKQQERFATHDVACGGRPAHQRRERAHNCANLAKMGGNKHSFGVRKLKAVEFK